jgi:hypothetical protein
MKLATHLHLVPRLRMRGAIPPLPHYVFMAWFLVKHRDNFTYTCNFMGWMMGGGFESWKGMGIFSSPARPDRLWDSPSLLSNGYQGLFPWE